MKELVKDALIALSDLVYKKNLNEMVLVLNEREMQIFNQNKDLVSTVHNHYDNDKNITKLEKK